MQMNRKECATNRLAPRNNTQINEPAGSRAVTLREYVAWFVAGLVLAASLPAPAQCPGCGTQVSPYVLNETWTAANSPYCVVSDVFVLGLTIESNVTVKVCGNYTFEVAGLLQVKGASNAPVLFTPQDPAVGWKGILFSDAVPGSFFNYAIIEGSKQSGVRITNTPPAFTNCIIRNNTTPGAGGGICAKVSGYPLVLQGCLITNNVATNSPGGGVWAAGSADFTECTISGNTAGYFGGGLCLRGPSQITRCTIAGNRGGQNGYSYGAGVFASGTCSLRSCLVTGNAGFDVGQEIGSGVCCASGGTLRMTDCRVLTNGLQVSGNPGGAVAIDGGNGVIINCVLAGNTRSGLYVPSGAVAVINCTVVANQQEGVYSTTFSTAVTNSIVFFNNANGSQASGPVNFAYSDVQGGVQPGVGNISFNPALCPQSLALILGSPCIDTGNPDPTYNDVCLDTSFCTLAAHGTPRNDMGAYGGPGACNWLAGDAPAIFSQPQSQTSCLGQSATYTVTATGSPPLTYQWFFNGSLLTGQTSNRLELANLQSSNSGPYAVVVANVFGSVTSAPANLVVYDACVDLHMYAGLDIAGQAGQTYVLSYVNDLNNTNWTALATNTLGGAGWFYLDLESAFQPKRFYKVKLKP